MSKQVDFSAEIILVCNNLDAGGIERVVSTLANEWSRRGRKVSVITLHDHKRFYQLNSAVHHVVVEQAGDSRLAHVLRALKRRLGSELRKPKPSLGFLLGPAINHFISESIQRIHFSLYLAFETAGLRRVLKRVEAPLVISFGTPINVITIKACRGLGRRVIISERNDPGKLVPSWGRLWKKYYRRAHLVTANTHAALRDMSTFVGGAPLAFVPNLLWPPGGNNHAARPNNSYPPLVLTVGRLVEDKAQDILLDAFARAGEDCEDWRLAIIGEGKLADTLRAQADDLGIADRVDWHGVVADPYEFYCRAEVFALPSRIEGTPNALLEAMSCGLAVVVSDGAPGPLELVEHGVTGLVVPVDDPLELSIALRRLMADRELRNRLGRAARKRVTEYDLPRALAMWETIVGLGPQSEDTTVEPGVIASAAETWAKVGGFADLVH
jgi:GalNAc-alpha-(1->4)-GalNAc-alpha-(1->3)-diNAcBac-PP-undecaprenol alpha-1,4-N-acetyl-D-galactosaminyltransferase